MSEPGVSERIDAFELEVFDHTGDFDLALHVGDCVRWAVTTTCEAMAELVGLPPEVFVDGVLDYIEGPKQ